MSRTNQQMDHRYIEQDASYQLLVATLDAATDGIIVICEQGRVQLFSLGAEKMFGYSSDEMLGSYVGALIPDSLDRSHSENLHRYISTEGRKTLGVARHVLVQGKSGEVFSVHLSLGEFQLGEEKLFVGVARDLRQQLHLTSELDKERQKNRQLLQKLHEVHQSSMFNELVSTMSHEINQPLTAITTYADLTKRILSKDSDEPTDLRENLEKISVQALRASDVIKKMRRIAPKSMLTSGTSNIGDLFVEIKDVVEAESELACCTIRWNWEDGLPLVRAEASQIQHVLIMLLRNSFNSFAYDAATRLATVAATKLSARFVQISVEDNGQSADNVTVDTLYHSFSSNKANEAGLNLSMCNTLIINHGGRIWHELVEEGGNRYVFTLPVSNQRSIYEAR